MKNYHVDYLTCMVYLLINLHYNLNSNIDDNQFMKGYHYYQSTFIIVHTLIIMIISHELIVIKITIEIRMKVNY